VGKKLYISYSIVPKKKENSDSCCVCRLFSGLAKTKVSSFFLCILTRVSQASGLGYADGLGDESTFITTELHQLAVYGEQ
jgi:hypothetical protein